MKTRKIDVMKGAEIDPIISDFCVKKPGLIRAFLRALHRVFC